MLQGSICTCLLMVLAEFWRNQSCVRSGRFRGCSVIQFCRLWMESNRTMIRQLVIKLHLFLETKELYSYGKAGSLPSSQPTLQLQDLWPPWGWDMLSHPMKGSTTLKDVPLGFRTLLSGKCIFLALSVPWYNSAVCPSPGTGDQPACCWNSAAPSADGLGWHSPQGPGWGEMQGVCGGGSTEHTIIYFHWLETTREINELPNHPG